MQPLWYSEIPMRELEDWKWNKHIDGRINCQPMDKADRRRIYAAAFGWHMAAWFWIPKPLHSIANPSRRKYSCRSWCSVAAFSFIQKSRENESRTEVQGHRIFFSEGNTGMEECRCTGKMLCGIVRRDSEHRIVSATIQIHAACGRELTQGTSLNTLLIIKFKTGG